MPDQKTNITPENVILAPVLHQLWEGLRERERLRTILGVFSSDAYEVGAAKAKKDPTALIIEIDRAEKVLLRDLVGLFDHVKVALQKFGGQTGKLRPFELFKPFAVAKALIDNSGTATIGHSALVSRRPDEGGDPMLHDVVFTMTVEGRMYRQMELVHDLLQFWEFFLRHQTSLECTNFCRACRTFLLGRVSMTIFQDAVTNLMPSPQSAATTASAEIHAADIKRRLEKIARHLSEQERHRRALHVFTAGDIPPASPKHKLHYDAMNIYHDELSLILSELVHLGDNVKKWLHVSTGSAKEMDIIEKMIPFRVASCFVNTEKHGIRAKNKTALFELTVMVLHAQEQRLSPGDQIRDQIAIINYDGQPWQASTLIDDLLQIWELFLRNHTSVDTATLRAEIAKRLRASQGLSQYEIKIDSGIEAYLDQRATERRNLG